MEESFDLFRMRLDLMVRPDHPLEILGTRIRWDEIENNLGHLFQRKPRQVREMELEGMFGKHRVMVSAERKRPVKAPVVFCLREARCDVTRRSRKGGRNREGLSGNSGWRPGRQAV